MGIKNSWKFFLTLVLVIGLFSFFKFVVFQKNDEEVAPQVAGASISRDDPNHPNETYFGRVGVMTLDQVIAYLNITVYPEDKIQAFPKPAMGLGSQIIIQRATPVTVTDAKLTKTYRTWTTTVMELLDENKIELLGKDSVEPNLNTKIAKNMKVKITRVAEVEVTEKEAIDFKTINKEDIDLEKGQTRIEKKGAKGEKELKYLIKRVDGEEVSRKLLETTVTKEPVTEIKIIGIGPKYVKNGPYVELLNAAARKYLINATALQCLMLRESGGTADTGYPDAQYKGLFQYEEGYWADASAVAGFEGASIYDAKAQIYATAYALIHGQSRRWPPYRYCIDK